jgi:hypothetical protein
VLSIAANVRLQIRAIRRYAISATTLRFDGAAGLIGWGQRSKYVSPCVCRGRNAFFFTMSWRASVFDLPLRGEQDETAGVNVANGALGPQSDDFCENALLEVC